MIFSLIGSIFAGVGFVGGFLLSVYSWAGDEALMMVGGSVAALVAATAVYSLLVSMLMAPKKIKRERARSLMASISPIVFFGSFIVGATGMRTAIWLIV